MADEWSDYKKWYMDIFKSIIIFALAAVLSYFIIDCLNNKREKKFYKWKVSENIYNDIVREFEIAFRQYEKNLEPCLKHKIFQNRNSYTLDKLHQYETNKNNLLKELNSLNYWTQKRGNDMTNLIQQMENKLSDIDRYPEQNIILRNEEYDPNKTDKYKEYWYTKNRTDKFLPLVDSFNSINEKILNKLLYIED